MVYRLNFQSQDGINLSMYQILEDVERFSFLVHGTFLSKECCWFAVI